MARGLQSPKGMKGKMRFRKIEKRLVCWTIIGILALTLPGCRDSLNEAGQKMSQTGIDTADNLAQYYESLAIDVLDYWEMATLFKAVTYYPTVGVKGEELAVQKEIDERDRQDIQEVIRACQNRAHVARRISIAYKALYNLSNYDAQAQMSEAARGLGDALASLNPFPEANVSPSELFAAAAGEFAAAQQAQDIKRGAQALCDIVRSAACLFELESPRYEHWEGRREEYAIRLCNALLKNNRVTSCPMTSSITLHLGLTWAKKDDSPNTLDLKAGLLEIATMNAEMLHKYAVSARQATLASLWLLSGSSRTLIVKGTANTVDVQNALQKSKYYLGKVSELRGDTTAK